MNTKVDAGADAPSGTRQAVLIVSDGPVVHEVAQYNETNGYGTTACGKPIGPGDLVSSGSVSCGECQVARLALGRLATRLAEELRSAGAGGVGPHGVHDTLVAHFMGQTHAVDTLLDDPPRALDAWTACGWNIPRSDVTAGGRVTCERCLDQQKARAGNIYLFTLARDGMVHELDPESPPERKCRTLCGLDQRPGDDAGPRRAVITCPACVEERRARYERPPVASSPKGDQRRTQTPTPAGAGGVVTGAGGAPVGPLAVPVLQPAAPAPTPSAEPRRDVFGDIERLFSRLIGKGYDGPALVMLNELYADFLRREPPGPTLAPTPASAPEGTKLPTLKLPGCPHCGGLMVGVVVRQFVVGKPEPETVIRWLCPETTEARPPLWKEVYAR